MNLLRLCLCAFIFHSSFVKADYISLEWLYLTCEQDDMAYALSPSEVLNLPRPWNSGFEVGLDLDITKKGVDTFLAYTQYLTSCSAKHEGTNFTSLTLVPISNPEASWNMAMRLLNLEIGHKIHFMKKLHLRSHVGLGAIWHHQNLHMNHSSIGVEQDLRRWGIGIRAGFNSNWLISHGFSIFADGALCAMWSRFRINRTDDDFLKTKNDFITIKPVIDTSMGLAWEQGTFAIRAGWTLYLFMRNNQLIYLNDNANLGDLSLMGGTLGITWGF